MSTKTKRAKQKKKRKQGDAWDLLPRYQYFYYRDNEVPNNDLHLADYPFYKERIAQLKALFKSRCTDFDLTVKFRTTWEDGKICTDGEVHADFEMSYWIDWASKARKEVVLNKYPDLLEAALEPLDEVWTLLDCRDGRWGDENLPWSDPEDCIENIQWLIQRLPPNFDLLGKMAKLGVDEALAQSIAAQEAELIAADRARRALMNCPFCKQEIQASDGLFHLRCTHPEVSDLKQLAAAWLLNVSKNEVGARVPRTSQAKRKCWTVDQLEQYLEAGFHL